MPRPSFEIKWNGDLIAGLAEVEVKKGIRDASLTLQRDAKLLIGEKGDLIRETLTGREVREPSLPGEPPHRVTGTLVSSVRHQFADGGLTGIIGSDLSYAAWLELGTSKMVPRPWLRPTFDRIVSQAEKFFGNSPF